MFALDKRRRVRFDNGVVETFPAWMSGDDEMAHLPLLSGDSNRILHRASETIDAGQINSI
jgi:hypothetical protein